MRFRTSWRWLVVAGLALALSVVGCKKDQEGAVEKAAEAVASKLDRPHRADASSAKKKAKTHRKLADRGPKKDAADKADRTKAADHKTTDRKGKPKAPEAAAAKVDAREAHEGDGPDGPHPRMLGPRRDTAAKLADKDANEPGARRAGRTAHRPGDRAAERAATRSRTPGKAQPPAPTKRGDVATAPPAPFTGEPLDVHELLKLSEVQEITKTKVRLRRSSLPGIPAHASYNALYFEDRKSDRFGVAVQVWKDSNRRDARWRFKQLAATFPNATENTAVTKRSFFAWWQNVYYLVFLVEGNRTTISISCGSHICKPEQLVDLGRKVLARVETK